MSPLLAPINEFFLANTGRPLIGNGGNGGKAGGTPGAGGTSGLIIGENGLNGL
ncbi:PE-PGRS family protein [Mycobacterium tuberculosis]|nr:PE-PGRS family protein [Mycobacterium tuberculosis]